MKQKGPSCSAAACQTLSQTQTGPETLSPSSGTERRERVRDRSHGHNRKIEEVLCEPVSVKKDELSGVQ